MDHHLAALVEDSGPLTAVRGKKEPDTFGYESLIFVFENGTLSLEAESDTDEIAATVEASPSPRPRHEAPTFCAALLGMTVEYAWTMVNHRGYADGFQARFLNLETRESRTLQFEVAASLIEVLEVT